MRWLVLLLGLALAQLTQSPASAAACTREDFALAVDRAGAALRKLNADNLPGLRAEMRELKVARGWPDEGFEEKAYEVLQDERMAALDGQANDLLAKLDALGTVEPSSEPDCAKLQELAASSLELQATVKAKAAYTLAKLDQMLKGPPAAPVAESKKEPKAKSAEAPKALPPPPAPKAPARPTQESSWEARTKGEPSREVAIAPPPPPPAQSAPPPLPPAVAAPEEEGYPMGGIMVASAEFFGKVWANLGAVIEYLFKTSGRPSGYVLGTEGLGVSGRGALRQRNPLHARRRNAADLLARPLDRHGFRRRPLENAVPDLPSSGRPSRFTQALPASTDRPISWAVFGATLVTNGSLILAPIRSGVGLRLGANIGYIRFTPKATWNPF